ncbi:DUF4160 domain-containing protein [Pleurocapsa sp. PCC 7319]|uniref:DUF4160 domain-containing protein n=1 Tax=Pleurocapsa sp. PCC 7319 TaxID=118161 RepID=UPI00034ADE1F|nr:DUF4160 domain-containing protein [Pleurocapsa sp. PCC 7319]
MPEILREDGYVVKIWFNDHPPRHVHVFKANGECVIELKDENNPPVLLKYEGMNRKEISKALRLVNSYQGKLLEEWQTIHGDK